MTQEMNELLDAARVVVIEATKARGGALIPKAIFDRLADAVVAQDPQA